MAVVAASALKVTLSPRPFADPDAAARKLMKLANALVTEAGAAMFA